MSPLCSFSAHNVLSCVSSRWRCIQVRLVSTWGNVGWVTSWTFILYTQTGNTWCSTLLCNLAAKRRGREVWGLQLWTTCLVDSVIVGDFPDTLFRILVPVIQKITFLKYRRILVAFLLGYIQRCLQIIRKKLLLWQLTVMNLLSWGRFGILALICQVFF